MAEPTETRLNGDDSRRESSPDVPGRDGSDDSWDSSPTKLPKDPAEGLLPALERLDQLLRRAIEITEADIGAENRADSFRGLYITQDDVERSLAGSPGEDILFDPKAGGGGLQPFDIEDDTRIVVVARAFALTPFDVNVLLLALAPEIDLKYEQVYAFLQDNVTRTRPTVELALNLLSRSVNQKIRRLERFRSAGPLVRHRIIELVADAAPVQPPLLAHFLRVDPQVSAFLLGLDGLDRRLADFAEPSDPITYLEELPVDRPTIEELARLHGQALETGRPLRLYLRGPPGNGRKAVAEALAAEAGMPMLTVNVERLLASDLDPRDAMRLLFRQAWMDGAVLLWVGIDALEGAGDGSLLEYFLEELRADEGFTVMAGELPWAPSRETAAGVVVVEIGSPGFDRRLAAWEASAEAHGVALTGHELRLLAARFELTITQIDDAITVGNQRTSRAGGQEEWAFPHVLAAARGESGHALAKLTRRIEPKYRKPDIVLPTETARQLDEICARVAMRHTVLDDWGWDDKLSLGKGTSALFSGPSGCGKSMAAEVIASEVGLELYRLDLATVMDKYIGETEKKLDQIFEAAESSNSVLLCDEADALFGKRSEVRDSHDRYANVEISYLLQKIEEYDGLVLLATNLPQNLDEAFTRRLTFVVRFPAPDAASRRLIWEKIWPERTPRADDLDLDFLAREYRLTGGNIKNIAMTACFYAAEAGTPVTMYHVLRATRREFAQLGKPITVPAPEGVRSVSLA